MVKDFLFTPDERKRVNAWQQSQEMGWANRLGPHIGKGPRNYVRSDERIYEEVCERMTQHGELDAGNVGAER
jgi:hypothetical protein